MMYSILLYYVPLATYDKNIFLLCSVAFAPYDVYISFYVLFHWLFIWEYTSYCVLFRLILMICSIILCYVPLAPYDLYFFYCFLFSWLLMGVYISCCALFHWLFMMCTFLFMLCSIGSL